MSIMTGLNRISRVIARPLVLGAAGAGAANLIGRYIPFVGGTAGMVVTGLAAATTTELVLYVWGNEVVEPKTLSNSLDEIVSRYAAADAMGKAVIVNEIKQALGENIGEAVVSGIEERAAQAA